MLTTSTMLLRDGHPCMGRATSFWDGRVHLRKDFAGELSIERYSTASLDDTLVRGFIAPLTISIGYLTRFHRYRSKRCIILFS